ncbi:MAG: hydroxyacylglutathione hydrolase [Arcticibacterium sp.]|jgi:hydroxyacylglutathione hydrolase
MKIRTFSETDLFEGTSPKQIKVSEWLPISEDIDLGGRTIQLINIPGHTDESVAIVDQERKLIFLGDFFYNGTLFTFKEGDIEKYINSVAKITAMIDEDYRLFGAHGFPEISLSNSNKLPRLLNCIKNENCQGTSQMAFGKPLLLYSLDGLQIASFQ